MTKLDEMLSKWPMRDSTQLEADEAAERVTGAITSGQLPSSVDESVFAPPLPKTADEGQTSPPRTSSKPGFAAPGIAVENKMSKDRTRDRSSFQELAKLATTPPPTSAVPSSPSSSGQSGVLRAKEAESSDSGIVDLKMIAQLDPTGAQRAQSTPLASDGLFDDESAPPKPAVTAAVAEKAMAASASSAPAAPAPAQAVAQPMPSAKAAMTTKEEKKGGGGVVLAIGALVAAAAIAAGGFFFVKYNRAHQAAVATQTSTPAPAKTAAATEKTPTTTQPTATAAATVAQNDTQQVQEMPDPNAQGGSKPMLKFHAKSGPGSTGGGAAPQDTATAAPTGTVDPKLVANVPTGGAGGGSGDLAEAMKAAAGGGTGLGQGAQTTDQGSKFAPGSVPQRPSQGQVAGAIGSVMPNAKACLGGDDPMSRATVTFQSDGTVKSVSVSGFAAGKPQEACIKAALSKAKVDPFAEATYPVPVSIRSN